MRVRWLLLAALVACSDGKRGGADVSETRVVLPARSEEAAELRAGRVAPRADALGGPATGRYVRADRAQKNAECTRCHAVAARSHATSLHARAFDDASFQRGYAAEPDAFCRSCHAPESPPAAEPDAFARAAGVACVTCHLPETSGPVLAAHDDPLAPHPLRVVEGFGSRVCAACHEFSFPGSARHGAAGLMQRTMSEHAASSSRDRECSACHMDGGHAFSASRDPARLAAAVDVGVTRDVEGRHVFTLRSRGVGHSFPTGDLFRRLVLRLRDPSGRSAEYPLARAFLADADGARFESTDTRLTEGAPRVLALTLRPGTRWELVYERVVAVGRARTSATVEAELTLARGAL